MKRLCSLFAAVAAMVQALSCDSAFEENAVHHVAALTACVDEGGDTKTVMMNGGTSFRPMWSGEEWIQVVGRGGSYWFGTNAASPVSSAVFTYDGDYDEGEVFAVYPAGSVEYAADFGTATVSNVTIPEKQRAVADSYDPLAAVAAAYSSTNTLKFRNAVAMLKFTMGSDRVKNVTIWGEVPEGKGIAGTGPIKFVDGIPVVEGMGMNYVSMTGDFEKGRTYYMAIAPVVFENGFTIEFSNDGDYNKYAVKSTSGRAEFKRNIVYDLGTIDDGGAAVPAGMTHGINYVDRNTVTLVLYDRDSRGGSHDFCNLLWDENWWGEPSKPKTSLRYDRSSGCWWITLTGLDPDRQYKFQYQLGYGDNVTVTTFDPYTEIVYDRSNDQYISSSTYPGLAEEYGDTHYGRDNGFVSAFRINRDRYDWKVEDYDIEDKNDLVIYEMLIRDFTDNTCGEGGVRAAMGKLDYLKSLGVNAVELMPVQEFDGNDSWGYGTHAYFALDKAYGTRNDYKAFIDACHQRGMAVILDVAYNHATGAHPYAAMYWDSYGNKTAPDNPWFNVDSPHQWSVYHDWNHGNPMVRDHVKRSLEYLLTEYKVDGFRFDLTKGFTQNSGTEERYDQSRVDILKEYNSHILSVDDGAVMICEHFCDEENWELGKNGIKVWRNMNHPYTKAMRRNMWEGDFTGLVNSYDESGYISDNLPFGTLVGYQESHDEERTNYLGQWEDNNGPGIPFATRIERAKINAAFFLLAPGPKMIWQFGEIGYDYSIEYNGRTGKKPVVTDSYMAVKERKELYDTYSMLLKFRRDNPRFFDSDARFRWYVDGNHQGGRYMFCEAADGKQFALFGNFGNGGGTIGLTLPHGGAWYQYDNSSAVWNGASHSPEMAEGQFYILVNDKSICPN